MKILIQRLLIIVLLGGPGVAMHHVWAQQETQDALRQTSFNLNSSKAARIDALIALSQSFFPALADSVLKYTEIGLSLVDSDVDQTQVAQLHIYHAGGLERQAKYDETVEELQLAENIARNTGDSALVMKVMSFYGRTYYDMGQYDESTKYNFELKRLAELLNDSLQIGNAYLRLSAIALARNDDEAAEEFSLKAITYGEAIRNGKILNFAYNNLAVYYDAIGEIEKAVTYFSKGLALLKLGTDSAKWALPLTNLGMSYVDLKQLDKAEIYVNEALYVTRSGNPPDMRSISLLVKGDLELAKGNPEAAWTSVKEALASVNDAKDVGLVEYVYGYAVGLAEEADSYQLAFEWQKTHHVLLDSLYSAKRMEKMEQLQVEYDMQKKDAENARLLWAQQRSQTRERQWLILAAFVALLLLGLITFLFWNNRRRARNNQMLSAQSAKINEQNAVLSSQNEKLNLLNDEMRALMGIVAHDLKAPLSKSEGLLYMLESNPARTDLDKTVMGKMRSVFEDGKKLIDELVLLNELEEQRGEVKKEMVDARMIAAETIASFQEVADKKQIQLNFESPEGDATMQSNAAYFKRILDNLVSNAIKFSPPGKNVWVNLAMQDAQLFMEIRDEGPGIPKSEIPMLFRKFSRLSNRPTAGESSTGLGLSIVKGLVDRLNGKLTVESVPGEGTTFQISIPSA